MNHCKIRYEKKRIYIGFLVLPEAFKDIAMRGGDPVASLFNAFHLQEFMSQSYWDR